MIFASAMLTNIEGFEYGLARSSVWDEICTILMAVGLRGRAGESRSISVVMLSTDM